MSAMSDEGHEDSGLFGKLPSSRPGVRSPRRASSKETAEPRSAPPRATPPRPKPTPARPKPTAARPKATAPPRAQPEEQEGEGAGLEELAWAGIAVTAEAATLGVRLVTRALDAARRATER
jgi:ribosomal protein L13E